jgi:arylsulfatase A-like enzyme
MDNRRDFLKKGSAVVAGSMLAELGILEAASSAGAKPGQRPNIVFILVDEMRFPTVFPAGITTPEQFLTQYMPNVHYLWQRGVKFERYYSSGNACSPARATIATGLYPHQQWLLATRTIGGPSLQTGFPTYGRLLRRLYNYQTPYFGKWHLSDPPADGTTNGYLQNYGFDGQTVPDPTGVNGEGYYRDGPDIAAKAVTWLQQSARRDQPFCATVSFVNPHDKQFFWAGSEGDAYESLFAGNSLVPFAASYKSVPLEDNPNPLAYPTVPPNWESYDALLANGKPTTQQLIRSFQEAVWGGVVDDPNGTGFSVSPSPIDPSKYGVAKAPYSYWKRGLDMYTTVLAMVDEQVGKVVAAVPRSIRGNTVFVFASDHGEYAGAHGLLSGKLASAYEEAIRIPLIVADPSHRYTKQVSKPRQQLVSSVDLVPMLVTLANRGSTRWRVGPLQKIYGERLNVVDILGSPKAKGRDHIVFSTDEVLPLALNYEKAPTHVLAVRTPKEKLVTYSFWLPGTTRPVKAKMQLEYYDYSTAEGRAETRSHPDDPRAKALAAKLFNQYVPQQTQQPLPPSLKTSVAKAKASYIAFEAAANGLTPQQLIQGGKLKSLLGYSGNF